jgi:flagellar basal body-associated protein FliL
MKKKRILASSLMVALSLSLGNFASAGGQGTWGSRSGEPRERVGIEKLLALLDSDRFRSYLGLEGPQVERLRQIALEMEKANVKTRAEIEVRSIELREALRADKPDRDEILKKVQEISDLRGGMMKQDVEAILAAKSVLTPEQQRKVMFLIENREEGGPAGEGRGGAHAKPLTKPRESPQPAPPHPDEPPVQ